jgi:hypothetical protein
MLAAIADAFDLLIKGDDGRFMNKVALATATTSARERPAPA